MNGLMDGQGIKYGIYWRMVGLTVLLIAVLQLLAFYAFHYPFTTSMPLAVLLVTYITVPRTKERRLLNAVLGVVLVFVIGLVFELLLQGLDPTLQKLPGPSTWGFWLNNAFYLVFGLLMSYVFLLVTQWSERKRVQMEEKRAREQAPNDRPTAQVRHHRTKKKRKRR